MDAAVLDNAFILLDTCSFGVSFFDAQGTLRKRVTLPQGIYFQNIVRDRDNSVYVMGTNGEQTHVVHIQNDVLTEQAVYQKGRLFIHAVIPDVKIY